MSPRPQTDRQKYIEKDLWRFTYPVSAEMLSQVAFHNYLNMTMESLIPVGEEGERAYYNVWKTHEEEAKKGQSFAFFVRANDQCDGFIICRSIPQDTTAENKEKCAEITQIYVRPDSRGRGIGTELMRAAVSCLENTGHTTLLATTPQDNSHLNSFFKKQWIGPVQQKDGTWRHVIRIQEPPLKSHISETPQQPKPTPISRDAYNSIPVSSRVKELLNCTLIP